MLIQLGRSTHKLQFLLVGFDEVQFEEVQPGPMLVQIIPFLKQLGQLFFQRLVIQIIVLVMRDLGPVLFSVIDLQYEFAEGQNCNKIAFILCGLGVVGEGLHFILEIEAA